LPFDNSIDICQGASEIGIIDPPKISADSLTVEIDKINEKQKR